MACVRFCGSGSCSGRSGRFHYFCISARAAAFADLAANTEHGKTVSSESSESIDALALCSRLLLLGAWLALEPERQQRNQPQAYDYFLRKHIIDFHTKWIKGRSCQSGIDRDSIRSYWTAPPTAGSYFTLCRSSERNCSMHDAESVFARST